MLSSFLADGYARRTLPEATHTVSHGMPGASLRRTVSVGRGAVGGRQAEPSQTLTPPPPTRQVTAGMFSDDYDKRAEQALENRGWKASSKKVDEDATERNSVSLACPLSAPLFP
uniref:Uncharacterized protein n=1 Tax=Panagrellus redivivus TaxID=6233 RepID=A0A7E4V5R1_PANRE